MKTDLGLVICEGVSSPALFTPKGDEKVANDYENRRPARLCHRGFILLRELRDLFNHMNWEKSNCRPVEYSKEKKQDSNKRALRSFSIIIYTRIFPFGFPYTQIWRINETEGLVLTTCLSSEVDPLPMSSATLTGAKVGCSFNIWRKRREIWAGVQVWFPHPLCMRNLMMTYLARNISSAKISHAMLPHVQTVCLFFKPSLVEK